jgi:tubulin beta
MQAGQSGSQMGAKYWKVVCDEHGSGGDNGPQLGRINVFYHEASGGKYVPGAVLFGLEPGVISALRASPLGKFFRPGNLVKRGRGQQLGQGPLHKGSAKPSGAFPSNIPAGLRARVSRLGGFTRPFSG